MELPENRVTMKFIIEITINLRVYVGPARAILLSFNRNVVKFPHFQDFNVI